MVGASLAVMERDARAQRGERPFVFSNLKTGEGLDQIIGFILDRGMLGLRGCRRGITPHFPAFPPLVPGALAGDHPDHER